MATVSCMINVEVGNGNAAWRPKTSIGYWYTSNWFSVSQAPHIKINADPKNMACVVYKCIPNRFSRGWAIVFITLAIFHVAMYPFIVSNSKISRDEKTVPIMLQECPNSLLILEDSGRMGNRIFEFLAAKILAEQLERTLYINQEFCEFILTYFSGLRTPVYGTLDNLEKRCNIPDSSFIELDINDMVNMNSIAAQLPFIKLTNGFPDFIPAPLWNVLHDRRDELLQEFQWRPDLKRETSSYIGSLTAKHSFSVLVGVHVRMTDYHAHMIEMYGPSKIPGPHYFNKSMTYYRTKYTNPLFMVVSNDIEWCRKTLKGNDVIFAGRGNETDPGWDLALLVSCDHLIITYGSYGAMAAYFVAGKGEVVAADNFTTRPNTFSENIRHSRWPNWHWIPVD